jgi:wyosine [tRNA(Phe)-imidazoG37] synthetase (radical SAM superfamily)
MSVLEAMAAYIHKANETHHITIKATGLVPANMGVGYWKDRPVSEIVKFFNEELRMSTAYEKLGRTRFFIVVQEVSPVNPDVLRVTGVSLYEARKAYTSDGVGVQWIAHD